MNLRLRLTLMGMVAIVLALALPLQAQDATTEPTADVIVLVPHTDETFGIEAVVPDGWTALGNGLFSPSGANDPVLVALQAAPLNAESLLNAVLPQLGLTEAPESVGAYDGLLDWTLYQVDVDAGGTTIRVDLALAENEGMTYLMLLQAPSEDYDALHESVFLPTLADYGPLAVETAEEDVPYTAEEVTFSNGDVTLAGTLTLPPTAGPHPAIVLVSGSGPQDRDETLGAGIAIKPFRLLADALTRTGVAVLRYDDRGVGGSGGDFMAATTDDFAADAEAAIRYLIAREDIDADQVGLLGHSEGGMVTAMLGARNEDLDFLIVLAGPAANVVDLLAVQGQRVLQSEGAPQEAIDAQENFLRELATLLDDPEALEELVYEHTLSQLEFLPEEDRAAIEDPEAFAREQAQQTAQQFSSDWFRTFLNYDPAVDWVQTTVPVLAIFGGKDVQVDAEQNVPALEAALEAGGNTDYEIVVLPDANHLFQQADTGAVSEYATLPPEFTPELLPTIIDWIETHLDLAG